MSRCRFPRFCAGFYEVHGAFPEASPPTEFPHLSSLIQARPRAWGNIHHRPGCGLDPARPAAHGAWRAAAHGAAR